MFCGGRVCAEMRALPAGPRIPLYRPGIKKTWNILIRQADLNRAWTEVCQLKPALRQMIYAAVRTVYEDAKLKGDKPPNLNEVVAAVQTVLLSQGYRAGKGQIQRQAKKSEFAQQRRPRGTTIASEKRHT